MFSGTQRKRLWLILYFVASAYPQTTTSPPTFNLSSPSLAAHANLPQHQLAGRNLTEALADTRLLANSKGIPWKGLDLIVSDGPGNLAGFSQEALMKLYNGIACRADSIVIGTVNAQASHVSTSNTSVYSDYSLVVEAVIGTSPNSPLKPNHAIAVTRPGGSVVIGDGRVNFEYREYPKLTPGNRYLQFLGRIPESGGYRPLDNWSTLVESKQGHWMIARSAFERLVLPAFSSLNLEAAVRGWLANCPQSGGVK